MRNWFEWRGLARRAARAGLALCVTVSALRAQTVFPAKPVWISVPRISGHLAAADMGVVINANDPYSLAVGEHYVRQRGIPADQVLRVAMPVKAMLNVSEFEALALEIKSAMGPQVQALALAWTQPYAVECNSITAAVTLGFVPELCSQTCAPSPPSVLFN